MIGYTFTGNWGEINRQFKNLPREVNSSIVWGQRKAAEKLVKIVKAHINNQDLGWAARSPRTTPNDPRVLVDMGEYYDSISAWRKYGVYYAGVPRDKYNSKGTRISEYALINELGSGDIPARPLWGPSFEELGGPHGVRDIVMQAIYRKLRELNTKGFDVGLNLRE